MHMYVWFNLVRYPSLRVCTISSRLHVEIQYTTPHHTTPHHTTPHHTTPPWYITQQSTIIHNATEHLNHTTTHQSKPHHHVPNVNLSPLLASCRAISFVMIPSSLNTPMSKHPSMIDFVKNNRSLAKNKVDPLIPGYGWNKYRRCGLVVNAE